MSSVSSVMSALGMVENVGVAVGISVVGLGEIQADVACIYADFKAFPVFPAPILDFWKVTNIVLKRHRVANSYLGKVA